MSGSGGLTKLGTGTLTLTGVNTFTGTTTISAGTLALSGGDDRLAATTPIFVSGGTLDLGGKSQATSGIVRFTSGTTTNGTIVKSSADYDGQAGTVNAVLAGDVGLNKSGSGTLTLTGVNTYSGPTMISLGGILNVNSSDALGNASATNTLIFNGGALQAASDISMQATRLVTLTNTNVGIIDTNGYNVSIAGVMSAAGGLSKRGLGTLTLTAANTYSGETIISEGTLKLSGGNNRLSTFGSIKVFQGTLDLDGNNQSISGTVTFLFGTTINGTITKSGAAYAGQAGDVHAVLAGAVGLTKTTFNTLTLTGANTYSGATTISDGILNVNSSNALGTLVPPTRCSSPVVGCKPAATSLPPRRV